MEPTQLLYLDDMTAETCTAIVRACHDEGGKTIVVLDQTIFYPQGGGQPFDKGTIKNDTALFHVHEVRFFEGIAKHIGFFENGFFKPSDKVTCIIDKERRLLMSRLHSAGHVIDIAVGKLGYDWLPGKAFHFPEGPYVEYSFPAAAALDKEALKQTLEGACNEIINQNMQMSVQRMPKEQLATVCKHVPDYIPTDKPSRVVMFGSFGCPCGGTHVNSLAEIGKIVIRKIKIDGTTIRVSYQCE